MNPTVVMTEMGRRAWAGPARGGAMLARIPQGKFAGEQYVETVVKYQVVLYFEIHVLF